MHDGRVLTIYATPFRGVQQRIASGKVDATGRFVAKVVVNRTTTITARFEGDDRYRASSATARVTSPAKIVDGVDAHITGVVGLPQGEKWLPNKT